MSSKRPPTPTALTSLNFTSWFSEKAKPENKPVPMGCCHRQIFHPKTKATWDGKLLREDFLNKEFVLPHEPIFADEVIVEVKEWDRYGKNDFIGRAVVNVNSVEKGEFVEYVIASKYDTTLAVKVEFIDDDTTVASSIHSPSVKTTHAQCKWLGKQLGHRGEKTFCHPVSDAYARWRQVGSANTCKEFKHDATWGL